MFIWNSIAMSNIIDAYCVYCCAQKMKQSTEKTKEITSKKAYNNRKRYYLNTVAMMHILRHYTHINAYKFSFLFLFFRDNGITVQILKYQLYCEGFLTLLLLFVPIENDVWISRINRCLYSFAALVIQPLFYLNGDANFRNRVLQHGLWRALKQELFQMNTQIQPIAQ